MLILQRRRRFIKKKLKETIDEGDILILCDFAENWSFVVQDAAKSFHRYNEQATRRHCYDFKHDTTNYAF